MSKSSKPVVVQSDFQWLAKAFGSYEFTYSFDEDGEEIDTSNPATTSFSENYEGVARDAFYDPASILSTMVEYVQEEGGKKVVQQLGLDEATILLNAQVSGADDSGYSHTIVFGNLDKGWMFVLESNVFEYSDDNYDLLANLKIETSLSPEVARKKYMNIVKAEGTACINIFTNQMENMKKSMPAEFYEDFGRMVEKSLLETELLRPVVVKKHKKEILSAVEEKVLPSSPKLKM